MSPPPPAKSSSRSMKLKKKMLKRQKIIAQERPDDIPNCPSLESVEYYNYDPDGAIVNINEWATTSSADEEENNNSKKESSSTKRKRLRSDPSTSSSADDYKTGKESEESKTGATLDVSQASKRLVTSDGSDGSFYSEQQSEPEKEETERERAKRHRRNKKKKRGTKRFSVRKETQEFFDNVLYALLSFGKHSAYLFGKMINFGGKYPTPAGVVLGIFLFYITIMYLEFSAAAFAEWWVQWFWPIIKCFLRFCERFHRNMALFYYEIMDLGQSTYCEMAALWCEKFGMLCEYRCSFIDMAWQRTRH